MKKNKFTEFFKGKGYFVLLFVGVVAIAAVALVGSQLTTTKNSGEQKSVDLNDTDNNIAAKNDVNQAAENNPVSEKIANNAGDKANDTTASNSTTGNTAKGNAAANKTAANVTAANKVADGKTAAKDVASNDVEYEDYSADNGNTASATADNSQKTDTSVATAGKVVAPDNSAPVDALSFKAEDGLQWPVKGNVIMNFSMDHTIYFATLMQYKCNPAIIIDAKVGAEVKASADGIVSDIQENNDETGYTVTMDIGNGYNLVYGQLKKDSVSLKIGDSVKKGDVIGKVAEPTKYYTVEGSNLYFEVTENNQAVNPMLYLH